MNYCKLIGPHIFQKFPVYAFCYVYRLHCQDFVIKVLKVGVALTFLQNIQKEQDKTL